MKRTNIVLDDKLIEQGKKLTGAKTSKALVHLALKNLVRQEKQKRILALEGKVTWTGNLDEMRLTRVV